MSIGFEKAYALQTDMNLPASEILYICIQNRTFEWRLWLFNSGWSFQLGNQRNIADYSQCGCKEAKRW